MNCERFLEDLIEAARGASKQEAIEHSQTCPRCAALLANQRELTRGFAALAANPEEAPQSLEGVLMAAFARQTDGKSVSRIGWFAVAGAIAAALIVGVNWRQPPVNPPGVVRLQEQPPPDYPKVAVASASPKRQRRHVAAVRSAARQATLELPAGFDPIPYADPLTPVEHAEMVRVKVDDQLNADLILGQDGLARAIRFVNVSQTRSQ